MIINPVENNISQIREELINGKLLVLPTDTLYALSCDASNEAAVENIYKYKARDREKSLPILCHEMRQVEQICEVSNLATNLAHAFWPGALTIVLPLKTSQTLVAPNVYNQMNSLAVRIPNSPLVLKIIKALGKPIIGTSANISGSFPISTAEEAINLFGNNVIAIEGTTKQLPSTILKVENDKYTLIREGAIKESEIQKIKKDA